ncbi:MAG: FGGY-family carbohydrate kinase [Lachnospiraceae bacterium]|nr:FGGY-family carbohydrate kinase [Lachnospiraceae bacterium]
MGNKELIASGKAVLGLELGSTRIKAVLIDEEHNPIATGGYEWENQLVNGIWTYDLKEAWQGVQACYQDLKKNVQEKYGVTLKKVEAIGVSGMMHGYVVFNEKEELLVPFRTWRNTMTEEAVTQLSEVFQFNVPQRWSIAHLYQAILSGEEHVSEIAYMTTLAGYIHWQLTGEKVMGVGEASGMFPIDATTQNYDGDMLDKFSNLEKVKAFSWNIREILPKVLVAGESAGTLTEEGAKLLDTSGELEAGIPMCPPEGDAGTGMVATNSVGVRTGNVSAGTSVFAMVVLEKALEKVHEELDIVTTPAGDNVAMVHCNNCTTDLNAWVNLFGEFASCMGMEIDKNELYGNLYRKALEGDKDCGGLVAYNFYSGEHIAKVNEGRPMFVRTPAANFNLANFMRTHLYASLASLKIGLNILLKEEKVKVDRIYGHGGLFKTKGVAQSILAAAFDAPVAVMETAGEGGPWGMAILASYMSKKDDGETLEAFLNNKVFKDSKGEVMEPVSEDVAGFEAYMEVYGAALEAERKAVETIVMK